MSDILDELLYLQWLIMTHEGSTPEQRMRRMHKLRKMYLHGFNYSMKPERMRTILLVGS